MTIDAELRARAQTWLDADPDPLSRAELQGVLDGGDEATLRERLTPLTFGTAGLRGAVGAGSGRMNLAVVLRAASGIARYVLDTHAARTAAPPLVVIGFDARPTSRAFAEASAGVLLAAGVRVVAFAEPVATPLVAFLGRARGAAATIVVTASHNPRGDNGYKVYGDDAVQITTPVDSEIARRIEQAPLARHVPCVAVSFAGEPHAGLELARVAEQHAYFAAISAALPAGAAARDLLIAHSALHGVGTVPLLRALADAGFSRVESVPEQAEPDGNFPTTPRPNPEEPGTLDLALAYAERRGSALLLVNDPDADRLAAAARLNGSLRVLDGNQLGALLADYCLSRPRGPDVPLVVGSVVSSPLVAALAASAGAHYERTHTGFKWLWHALLALEAEGAGAACFAYEEALGYSVYSAVRDKDGIAAGRALAELCASLSARGSSLFERLHELYALHGLWLSGAQSVELAGPGATARIPACLDALITSSELCLLGERVTRRVDYRTGAAERRPWLGAAPLVELELESGSLLFVRPSGTEPKLKLYAHVRRSITREDDLARALEDARRFATQLLSALAAALRW